MSTLMTTIAHKDLIPSTIERKTFPFEVKKFHTDDKFFYFEGYLSTFGNKDRGDDIVVKGAFTESLKELTPSLFWSHKGDEPLGVFDSIVEDSVGLYVKGRMPLEDTFVKGRIVPQMEIGSIKSMSIGFSVKENGSEYKNGTRYLSDLKLWEGSLVTIPMNERANLKSIMSMQDDLPIAPRSTHWDWWEAKRRVIAWCGADEGGIADVEIQEKFKKAFLYHVSYEAHEISSYYFGIADVIGGQLTIVPRALFAVAAELRNDVYPIYIPPIDIVVIIDTVKKYYDKMDLGDPFGEKCFRIDDLKALDPRTMEKLFCSGIKVSKKNAKTLVSFVKSGLTGDGQSKTERDAPETKGKCDSGWSEVLDSVQKIKQL